MKVNELIEKLSKLDPTLEVIGYTEDEKLLPAKDRFFLLFAIDDVSVTEAERVHTDDGQPYLKFGRSEASRKIATLGITSDF